MQLFELMQAGDRHPADGRRIRSRVKRQMERNQKEYYLNEQMSAIQKELGEPDEFKRRSRKSRRGAARQADVRRGAGSRAQGGAAS
ncbi:MAG: hypothetical protein IPG96_20340 [Proteobacteria bacterium]|nr:hypothetical protein [Pseudomonadota bacterium]